MFTDPNGNSFKSVISTIWNGIKSTGKKIGESLKAIGENLVINAGIGQGIGGEFTAFDFLGVDLEFSGNYFNIHLEDFSFTFGQELDAEANFSFLGNTYGAGAETRYSMDGEIVSDNEWTVVDPSVYPDMPVTIVSGSYMLALVVLFRLILS